MNSWTSDDYILVHFFLFKQKTAYEMRIRDWSSDVCSSDLVADGVKIRANSHIEGAPYRAAWRDREVGEIVPSDFGLMKLEDPDLATPYADRKSVEEGKSVAGRVDIGGCRIIQKKKHR